MSDLKKVPLIETIDLCKVYSDGAVNALKDVNIQIQHNEYVAIMGPSGCGKSTLLSMLGALDYPTTGDVLFAGKPIRQLPSLDQFRSQEIGFVFQAFFLLPTLTALENVQIPMFEMPHSSRERINIARDLLKVVGMEHRSSHLPAQLSIGERQRIAIARSLANSPSVLFADEPTGNLDSKNEVEILNLFESLQQDRQMTLVVVTHSDEVAKHAQRIIQLKDGQVIDQGLASHAK
jgi:putative ABC transport system ATP-binding protein